MESPFSILRVLLLPLCFLLVMSVAAQDMSKVNNVTSAVYEFQLRAGIPNLLRKARTADGRTIRVAYLGGSITEANGWRVKTLAGFKTRFPGVNWVDINAGVGGTGSDLGVFRLRKQVLDENPDLMFVEFAVNDGGSGYTQRAMEGIVRQTWANNPEIDIIFVYTCNQSILNNVKAGITDFAIKNMELIATHYAVPSIHFGIEVQRLITKGDVVWKAPATKGEDIFTYDGTHPNDYGHYVYASIVKRGFDEFVKDPAQTNPVFHTLGTPLNANHWADARMVPVRQDMLTGIWTKSTTGSTGVDNAKRFSRWVTDIWYTNTAGSKLNLQFKGEVVGFFDILGPEGCLIRWKVNNGSESVFTRFDNGSTSTRTHYFFPSTVLSRDMVNSCSAALDANNPSKRDILEEAGKVAEYDANPAKFAPKVWYVGAVLLVGEEVKTSVEQNSIKESCIYPTSTSDRIYFNNLPIDCSIVLVDMSGKNLLVRKASDVNNGLSLQLFQSGIYLVKILQGNRIVQSVKVLKI